VDLNRLEQQGLGLLQEAAQLAQFEQIPLALARVRLATQMAPKSAEAWAVLGSLYLHPATNQPAAAIPALKRAQALDPRNAAINFALGSAYFQQQQYTDSVSAIKAGLKIKPNTPGALFDLGNAYMMLKRPKDAVDNYQRAIAQDKTFWPAINNIGLVRYETGDVDEALKLWRQALSLSPKAAEPQLAIAVALYTKGDREQGLALGEVALKIDAQYGEVKFLKENLWGDKLLADTQKFLSVPRIQAALIEAQAERATRPQQNQ
jgi:tetratricopeptide (TPR) repeat protein